MRALEQHPQVNYWRELNNKKAQLDYEADQAYQQYKALGGEVESRLVEKRSNNLGHPTPQTYPPSEYDVPPARQIIRRTPPKGTP